MKVFDDISLSIGNTPLVRINKLTKHPNLLVKIESRNPAKSYWRQYGIYRIVQGCDFLF
jgi:cysteine synthase A